MFHVEALIATTSFLCVIHLRSQWNLEIFCVQGIRVLQSFKYIMCHALLSESKQIGCMDIGLRNSQMKVWVLERVYNWKIYIYIYLITWASENWDFHDMFSYIMMGSFFDRRPRPIWVAMPLTLTTRPG